MRSQKGGIVARRENLNFFFSPPTMDMGLHRLRLWSYGSCSVLYLLRREIQDCFIGKIVPESEVYGTEEKHRLFATVMVIISGIDLLSKFSEGDDTGDVGKRFIRFLMVYAKLTPREAKAVWYLRNAQMHSFGLADIEFKRRKGKPTSSRLRWRLGLSEYCALPRGVLEPVQKESKTRFVCVEHLYEVFRLALIRYEEEVRNNNELGKRFTKMFWRYGFLDTR